MNLSDKEDLVAILDTEVYKLRSKVVALVNL